jgi:hypothetical protein
MPTKGSELAAQLRQAIQAALDGGKTLQDLGRVSGLDAGRVSRFIRAERDLTFDAYAAIGQAVGLELTWVPRGGPSPAADKKKPAAKKGK